MALNLPRLMAQVRKELLCVLRDPRSRTVLVVAPLMQLLVFSFAVTLEVRNVTIAVEDRDGGPRAADLIAALGASSFVGRLERIDGPQAMREALDRREALAVVAIPQGFSADLAAGRPTQVQALFDGRRANASQIAAGYLDAVLARIGANAERGPEPAVRHWFNPNLIHQWFVAPGLSGILTTFTTLLVTALSIARERELGTFEQLLVSPATSAEIILAKAAPGLAIGATLGGLMMLTAHFVFGAPFTGALLPLIGALVLFVLSMIGVGLLISAISSTQQQAILGTFAVGVPMVLMSGFATPVETMPTVLQWIAEALPLKHFLVIVHGVFLKGFTAVQIAIAAWPLAVIAALTLGAAVALVRRRLA